MTGDELEFEEATHTYRVRGVVLPSVTQIIKPVSPSFDMVDPATLEQKRQFGVAVHLACELVERGELDDSATHPRIMGCVAAWLSFLSDAQATVLASETKHYSPIHRFAGRIDRVVDMRTGPLLIDLKTSDQAYPSYGVQTAGYAVMLEEEFGKLQRATLLLSDDGKYRLVPHNDPADFAAFMGCLAIYHWKRNNQ